MRRRFGFPIDARKGTPKGSPCYPNAPITLVLSNSLWRRRFASDASVVGRGVKLDGQPATIVGVMPAEFRSPLMEGVDFWAAMRRAATAARSPVRYITVLARLGSGLTLPQAESRLPTIASRLSANFPDTNRNWGLRLEPVLDATVGWAREPLFLLQGVVALVLLIACVNIAGLLLAQGSSRRREIAVRAALGSGRGRIVRQFLAESLLLSLAGGAAGVGVAWAGLRLLIALNPVWLPRLAEVTIDGRVMGVALVTSVASALVFGMLPAVQASRVDLLDALKDGGRQEPGVARHRLRSALVVAEVAMALVLLISAGLLVNAFVRLSLNRPGFDTDRLLTFQLRLPIPEFVKSLDYDAEGHRNTEISPRAWQIFEDVRARVAAVPGVRAASTAEFGPLTPAFTMGYAIEGAPQGAPGSSVTAWNPVGAGYLRSVGVPLVGGREFEPTDTLAGTPVAIVSESLARQAWHGGDPIGHHITIDLPNDPPREVIGIAADTRSSAYEQQPRPQIYVPLSQLPLHSQGRFNSTRMNVTFVVRVAGEAAALVPALRTAVAQQFPGRAIYNVRTIDDIMATQLQQPRQYAMILAMFASGSWLLALVGIYGLIAYSVVQRTFEIGIRLALGATHGRVLRSILRQGLTLVGIGTVLGIAISIGATRLFTSFLWGVKPTDPPTYAAVVAAMFIVALLACYLPARRALAIDPMVALRSE